MLEHIGVEYPEIKELVFDRGRKPKVHVAKRSEAVDILNCYPSITNLRA